MTAVAEEQRADLLAKKATVAEMNARVTVAKRAEWPKLRGNGQVGWLEYSKHQGNGYNYNVGLFLDVPLFKGFEYTYRKRLALAEAEMTEAELKELQDAIALEVLTFSKTAQAAQEALQWSDQYLDEAAESLMKALYAVINPGCKIFLIFSKPSAISPTPELKKRKQERSGLYRLQNWPSLQGAY